MELKLFFSIRLLFNCFSLCFVWFSLVWLCLVQVKFGFTLSNNFLCISLIDCLRWSLLLFLLVLMFCYSSSYWFFSLVVHLYIDYSIWFVLLLWLLVSMFIGCCFSHHLIPSHWLLFTLWLLFLVGYDISWFGLISYVLVLHYLLYGIFINPIIEYIFFFDWQSLDVSCACIVSLNWDVR